MQPGDVLLLSGRGDLEERLQALMKSPWNQTAIAVPRKGLPNETALLLCTSRPVAPDLESGQRATGVQMVTLAEQLRSHRGIVAVRRIAPSLDGIQMNLLVEFAARTHGRPFNTSPYYSARALRRRNQPGTGTDFFCTELVAAAYMHAGVLQLPPEGRSASNYAPRDFAPETESLCLNTRFSFGQLEAPSRTRSTPANCADSGSSI